MRTPKKNQNPPPNTSVSDIVSIAEHAIAHPETWVDLSGVSDAEFLEMLRTGQRSSAAHR